MTPEHEQDEQPSAARAMLVVTAISRDTWAPTLMRRRWLRRRFHELRTLGRGPLGRFRARLDERRRGERD